MKSSGWLLESEGHLIDDVGVVGCGLVVHAPSAVDEFETTVVNQVAHDVLLLLRLLLPPLREEGHLHVDEPSVGYQARRK